MANDALVVTLTLAGLTSLVALLWLGIWLLLRDDDNGRIVQVAVQNLSDGDLVMLYLGDRRLSQLELQETLDRLRRAGDRIGVSVEWLIVSSPDFDVRVLRNSDEAAPAYRTVKLPLN